MKRFKILILGIAVAATFTNCKKDLDLQPTDTFSDANAFLTMSDVQAGVNEGYRRYGFFGSDYGGYANDMYVSALLSDEAKFGLDNAGQGALTYRYQFSSDATTGDDVIAAFGSYYYLIDQVNRVLPFVGTVPATAAEEPRRDILKGTLLGLRGIAHFSLLEMYSKKYDANDPLGIPYMTESNPVGKPARATVAETIAAIESDLATAKELFPATTAANFTDTVLNKVNIAAYQARIALYKRDYDAAITYATEVINSNVKPLVNGPAFSGIWVDANSNEVLFRIRFATSSQLGGLFGTTGGQIYIAPSDKLVATYAADDIRKDAYIGTNSTGYNYVNKFFTSVRGGLVVDIKAARTAEMYLIRAEANARKAAPNLTAGAADLNFLRANRITSYTDQTFASADALVTAVMEERFKELAFEGFRFFDLKRNSLPVERLASDASEAWQTLPANSFRFVLPIPASELRVNPNMVQNEGYN